MAAARLQKVLFSGHKRGWAAVSWSSSEAITRQEVCFGSGHGATDDVLPCSEVGPGQTAIAPLPKHVDFVIATVRLYDSAGNLAIKTSHGAQLIAPEQLQQPSITLQGLDADGTTAPRCTGLHVVLQAPPALPKCGLTLSWRLCEPPRPCNASFMTYNASKISLANHVEQAPLRPRLLEARITACTGAHTFARSATFACQANEGEEGEWKGDEEGEAVAAKGEGEEMVVEPPTDTCVSTVPSLSLKPPPIDVATGATASRAR